MTTSDRPWSTKLHHTKGSVIYDNYGNKIGHFIDSNNAELVVETFDKLAKSEEAVEELEAELAEIVNPLTDNEKAVLAKAETLNEDPHAITY